MSDLAAVCWGKTPAMGERWCLLLLPRGLLLFMAAVWVWC